MRLRHFTPLCLLALLALIPPPGYALRPDILYLGGGKFVQVGPIRQLTLNAHVSQFAYEPLGQEVALVGRETVGDTPPRISEALDVTAGTTAPYTNAPKTKPASLLYPNLALDAEARTLEDKQATGAQAASHILWLRRSDPSKDPLSAAAAAVTSGDDDPRPVWSPTGRQIAYVTHGDLCVTDLTAPNAIPAERQALGLPLTCAEERALARVNIKNVDMAMFWYSMRHDGMFPTAGEFQSVIAANPDYAKDLHTESVRFVYHEPPDRLRGHLEKQRELVIGEFDLPCARVVLTGDGAVKTLPKPGVSPEGTN